MNKKIILTAFLIILLILIGSIFVTIKFFYTSYEDVQLSQSIKVSYCRDSDGKQAVQEKNKGFVLYMESECKSIAETTSNKGCGIFITLNDYCENDFILTEYICKGNSLGINKINCKNRCSNGRCK